MVAVTYRRWSFTRGSNCRALTDKNLVFWISGHLWEVVAYKRWLQMEVRLYLKLKILPPLGLFWGVGAGGENPPPPPATELTCGFLIQLVFCKKKTMWFISVEVE